MTQSNIPDLPPAHFVNMQSLAEQGDRATTSIGHFSAAGAQYQVKWLGHIVLTEEWKRLVANNLPADPAHLEALNDGLPFCLRFGAIGPDGKVYAVWEVYSAEKDLGARMVSRTLEVDADWVNQGIGTGFALLMRTALGVQWSTRFSTAGAKLKDKIESLEKAPGASS